MKKKTVFTIASGLLAANLAIAATAGDVRRLVDQNQAIEAYQLGRAHPEELGNPEFDLYYGIAAVDSGRSSEGSLALERYVLNFPNDLRARLELARAYFAIGDDLRAREEFESVRALNPPANVIATIDGYIDAIRAREGNYQTTASFYIESGLGTDSNVNGGVSGSNINLPGLGAIQVDRSGVKAGDTFSRYAVGGQASTPIAPGMWLMSGGSYDSLLHPTQKAFDMDSITGFGGISTRRGANAFRVVGNANTLYLGGSKYRDIIGASGEWSHQLDELQTISATTSYADLNYAGTNQVRDARLTGVGFGYRKAFATSWQPIVSAGANYSEETNGRQRPDLGRNITGFNLGLSLSPLAQWGVTLSYAYQDSLYNAADLIMNTARHDVAQTVALTVIHLITKQLSLRGEASFSENKSNLALYAYDRTLVGISLRYDFR